ncbi:unnamed protein product [Thelazia callipaeda]|uniref:CBF domain-containing protein n=1 Tax=Thelazia callipaeda TaxID=103827 RepID=A0A0N5CRT4_THECL|nr:unnamed protein product [Thelazia callipaeda]
MVSVQSTKRVKRTRKKKQIPAVCSSVRHLAGSKWYEYGDEERTQKPVSDFDHLKKVEEQAGIFLRIDRDLHMQEHAKKNETESAWLNTVLIRGTANDKAIAMQILTQRHPLHSLPHIAGLIAMISKKNTREAFSVLGLLKDLFIEELLPPKRKLIPFSSRPVDQINPSILNENHNLKRKLMLWKFESDLKALYEKFIISLERLTGINVEKLSISACRYSLELLLKRPEQEQKLLSLLINKLGHPNKTLATRVCGYLLQLTRKQPLMRTVIVKEVERLVYRKNIACSAQLHAVSFLSQIDLSSCDPVLPSTLLNIYIGLFRMFVSNKQLDDRILGILISATSRVFPYAKDDAVKLMKEVDTLYKILHQSSFSTSVRTLKLLYLLLTSREGICDRFYAALYRRIIDFGHSTNVNRQLFSLLHQALDSDPEEHRVIAFIKRLLQLSLCSAAPVAASTLILISKLIDKRPSLLITQKAADITKFDEDMKSEIDSDDDEVYQDYDLVSPVRKNQALAFEEDAKVDEAVKCNGVVGWVHKNNIVVRNNALTYDPLARNPLFAKANKSVAAELTLLSMHYHPSVAVFASNLLKGVKVRYDGDPFHDFTQMHFLDRFVFRNPKTRDACSKAVRRKAYDPLGVRKLSVLSKEYAEKNTNEIPIDERYIHRFASLKMKMKKRSEDKRAHDNDDDDIESVNSDEFDLLLKRFEPGERREVFDIDFGQEFSSEKETKEIGSRKRSHENNVDEEDDLSTDVNDEMEEGWTEEEMSEPEDSEVESSDDEFILQKKAADDSGDSDDDLREHLDYGEDAAMSADKFATMLEEENESRSRESRRKVKKPRGFKKRKKK